MTAAELPEEEKPDLIIAAAIVEVGKDAFLYSGVVEHYYLNDDGQLDRLVLSGTSRRPIAADKESPEQAKEERFYTIDGNFFVLRYSEAITLNIQYVKFEDIVGNMLAVESEDTAHITGTTTQTETAAPRSTEERS